MPKPKRPSAHTAFSVSSFALKPAVLPCTPFAAAANAAFSRSSGSTFVSNAARFTLAMLQPMYSYSGIVSSCAVWAYSAFSRSSAAASFFIMCPLPNSPWYISFTASVGRISG